MTPEQFLDAVRADSYEAGIRAVRDRLTRPAGRAPHVKDVELSQWYNGLGDADRQAVESVIRASVDMGIFGFLSILDGSSGIGSQSEPVLVVDGVEITKDRDLHELWKSIVDLDGRESR